MEMIYAVGDIHGMLNKLEALYSKILEDIETLGVTDAVIIFLGDYIDRGPDSKGVLDFIMSLRDTDRIRHVALKGNHEDMFTTAYFNPEDLRYRSPFLANGGHETLKSLAIDPSWGFPTVADSPRILPYMKWMQSLPLKYRVGEYVFVHGGYDPRIGYHDQKEDVLLWKRTKNTPIAYINCEYIIVRGHTPSSAPIDYPREIGVDTGAQFQDSPLTAVALYIPGDGTSVKPRRFIHSNGLELNTLRL